jgi:putative acetyltransferase
MTDLAPQIAAVRNASRRMVRQLGFLERHLAGSALSHSQCHALIELSRAESLGVAELAAILALDKSSTSRIVAALVARGAVVIATAPDDARRRVARLTEAGRRLLAEVDARADGQVGTALSLLDAATRQQVVAGLEAYARALERVRSAAGVEIRPIRDQDDRAVEQVIRQVMTSYGATGAGFSIQDPEVSAMSAAYAGARAAYFVAVHHGVVLGGAGVAPLAGGDPATCELKKMYLLPAGRGLGLGQRLLDRCLAAARERGFRRCYLETLSSMHEAQRLYERNGFRPLCAAEGATGHFGCDRWYALELGERAAEPPAPAALRC